MRKWMLTLLCLMMFAGTAWSWGIGTIIGNMIPTYHINKIVIGDRVQTNCSGTWTPWSDNDPNWVIMCPRVPGYPFYNSYPAVTWEGKDHDTSLKKPQDANVYRKWGNLETYWGGDW